MNSLTTIEKDVNFVREGEGAPVILIHGLAASLYDWKDLLPDLAAAGYAGYALDLLGHGESHKPAHLEEYSVENVFDHFSLWLDSLKCSEPLTFIGHSLGGYLALEYALRYPERVRALVLVDPFYSLDQLPPLLRLRYKGPLINATMIQRTPEWMFRLAIDITSLSIRNGHILPDDVRAQTAADYKRAHPGIFNIPTTIRDILPLVHHLKVPALVIWGSRDQTLAPASFTRLATTLPNGRTAAIKAGHVPHQSHPAEFNRHVLEFLQAIDNGR
jgi:pimeloyl-ACP methyl ester carboxylesterase